MGSVGFYGNKVMILLCLPLADQNHVGIAPGSVQARQNPSEGEEETGENYCTTSQNFQHPAEGWSSKSAWRPDSLPADTQPGYTRC